MRILVVSSSYPYPIEHGVNLRLAAFARNLSKSHDVDLLCFSDTRPNDSENIFRDVKVVPQPVKKSPRSPSQKLLDKFSMASLIPKSDDAFQYISHVLKTKQYDLIFAYEPMITSLPHQIGIPLVVDIIDSGVLQYWREFRFSKGFTKKISMLKWLTLSFLFDKKYFSRASAAIFVADEDLKYFDIACKNTPSFVIQNGVDHEFFSPQGREEKDKEIVFEGSFSHPPNVDGAIYFATRILPIIQSQIPDVHFTIVGRSPTQEVKNLANEHITVTGFVDDVRPYLDQAAVFVCPLRRGGGIKNKVLQAWAMGKPVIATTASIGGLSVSEGKNIMVRNSEESFAEAVIELLRTPGKRKQLGHNARNTILNNYTWDKKSAELEELMITLTRNNP